MATVYDDPAFFAAYAGMGRSRGGLAAAGEWHLLAPLFPEMEGRDVLDLGCGYGWHCRYAADHGARSVLGVDLSEAMIAAAKEKNPHPAITYRVAAIEGYPFPEEAYDLVVSNLALHYVEDLDEVYRGVHRALREGGVFLFNIEHPTYTAGVREEWITDAAGRVLCWPVDDYYYPGERVTDFLGFPVKKYHHTLTQILMGLIEAGFVLEAVVEGAPDPAQLDLPGMRDEMRRPMMLLVRARKGAAR